MRLIDADRLKAYIDAQKGRPFIGCTIGEALKIMTDEQPTVDAVPVRHGRWRHYEGMLTCSECGMEFYDDIMEYCGDHVPKFCPECGADMREDGDND